MCGHCGRCWEHGGSGPEVDVLACPGCPLRGTCEACLTWLAASKSHHHLLADEEEILIRPLVHGDRFELAAGFANLSQRSRVARFFQAPDELDADDLEYLTNLDHHDHVAYAALLTGGPVPRGIGVGRYQRDPADPTVAEVAVTVMDEHQRRGVGTLLTRTLATEAAAAGVRTFVSYIRWNNEVPIEALSREGARTTPSEPGIARVELDLPQPLDRRADPRVRRILSRLAALDQVIGHPARPEARATREKRMGNR